MLEPGKCHIPQKRILDDADALGGNRSYRDLRYLNWHSVGFYLSLEDVLLALIEDKRKLEAPADADDGYGETEDIAERMVDEFLEDKIQSDMDLVGFLDFGLYSCVAALSACACVPVSSCNGGVFGGHHNSAHPVVAFHARATRCTLLNAAAEQAEVDLWHHDDEVAVVGSQDIGGLRRFARAVLDLHRTIPADKVQRSGRPERGVSDSQLKLGL